MKLVSLYAADDFLDKLEVLYELLSERPVENRISHRKMPSFVDHCDFAMSMPFRYWYLITVDDLYIGSIECLPTNEFGVHILKSHQRKGYGSQAVELFLATHQPLPAITAKRNGRWLANIAVKNEASKTFFARLGFQPLQETWAL